MLKKIISDNIIAFKKLSLIILLLYFFLSLFVLSSCGFSCFSLRCMCLGSSNWFLMLPGGTIIPKFMVLGSLHYSKKSIASLILLILLISYVSLLTFLMKQDLRGSFEYAEKIGVKRFAESISKDATRIPIIAQPWKRCDRKIGCFRKLVSLVVQSLNITLGPIKDCSP